MRRRNIARLVLVLAGLCLTAAGCVTEDGTRAWRAWNAEPGDWMQPLGSE